MQKRDCDDRESDRGIKKDFGMKEFINEKYIDENGDEIRIITNGEGKFYIKK